MPENEIGFPVLDTYEITYKNKILKVEIIEINMPVPTQYYLVYMSWGKVMLRRFPLSHNKEFWLGGNRHLPFEEAKELGLEIEKQTGRILATPESDNPFEYKGSVPIMVYSCAIGDITIKEAKSPFTNSTYYKVDMGTSTITLVDSELFHEHVWTCEENLAEADFELIKSVVIDAKNKMPWIAD